MHFRTHNGSISIIIIIITSRCVVFCHQVMTAH